MSFSQGRPFLAIPGPSPLPDPVIRAMARPSPDIYGPELAGLNARIARQLKRLAGTGAHLAAYIGNGHAAWEAANANMLNRGERVLVLVSGHFAQSWADNAEARGIVVERIGSGPAAPDPGRLAERLRQDPAHLIRAVLVCHIDTASSVRADIPALRAAMGDHPALLAVDAIASLGCDRLLMDEWGIDVLVSASQKGMMAPPGMGFVWFSDRARARGRTDLTTPYWEWTARADARESWQYWGGTPPVQLVHALETALAMLLDDETLPAAWARHEGLAQATWAAIDAWSAGNPGIAHVVADPAARARAVTALTLPGAAGLRAWVQQKAGLTLGIGLGASDPENAMRIAHMGHVSAHQHLGTLATIQAGMQALDIAHGTGGVEAAASVIARLS